MINNNHEDSSRENVKRGWKGKSLLLDKNEVIQNLMFSHPSWRVMRGIDKLNTLQVYPVYITGATHYISSPFHV